jgi:hypothetical protein
MVDTMRTLSEAYTLLADNEVGNISAQDMRDVVKTLAPGHGEIYITTPAATTLSDTSTWVDAAGTYALSADVMNWDMNTNGQLRYIGAAQRSVHIAASVSFTVAGTNDIVEVVVAKNSVNIASSRVQRKVGTGADVGSTALHGFTTIVTNDYITVEVRNITAADDVTFQTLNLFCMDMPH